MPLFRQRVEQLILLENEGQRLFMQSHDLWKRIIIYLLFAICFVLAISTFILLIFLCALVCGIFAALFPNAWILRNDDLCVLISIGLAGLLTFYVIRLDNRRWRIIKRLNEAIGKIQNKSTKEEKSYNRD